MYLCGVLIGLGFIWSVPKVTCACSMDCRSCTSDVGVQICTSCRAGYWLDKSSCLPCSNNCATCSNESSCSTCKPGFYSPTSICYLPCSTQCLNGLCGENTGYCTECPSDRYGYHCDFDCRLCKNEQCDLRQCTDGCKGGYWQYQDGNYTTCRPCVDNCLSCVNTFICTECKEGTYLFSYSATPNVCLPCSSTCEKCSKINSCSACKPGFYGTACNFNCSATIAGCQLCDWDSVWTVTCSQCFYGWTLQDNSCVAVPQQCPINCERCSGDNVCEACKTGWVGALCDEACQDIPHCVACHKTDVSIVCNVCDEGYAVMNGECSATSTNTKAIQSPSTPFSPASTKATTALPAMATTAIGSTMTSTISEPSVYDNNTPMPQSENTRFQTSTFLIGLVAGIGICICAILLRVLVWFMRRKRLQKSKTSRHNEPFYENSVATNESNLTTINSAGPHNDNIQQMRTIEENVSDTVDAQHNTTVGSERVSTSAYTDNHEYSSLNVHHGEHIYKDLTAM